MSIPSVNPETSSRERILDAAEALFAKRGYAGVGLREVAEVVGLGKSSLFHHFKNKPQLYAAVCARILRRIEERLMRALAAGGTPVERLERWLDDLIDTLADNPSYARVLLRSLFEDDELGGDMPEEVEADRAIQSVMGGVAALLREGMSTGQFRAANVPHLLLSLVGQIIFPFASGDFGKEILGRDVYDPAEVKRRKQELRDFIRFGLVARTST
ncbi:MAG TPA: TetR/AcrR family transcriptional regulator [Candidatus Binatia bacterium]